MTSPGRNPVTPPPAGLSPEVASSPEAAQAFIKALARQLDLPDPTRGIGVGRGKSHPVDRGPGREVEAALETVEQTDDPALARQLIRDIARTMGHDLDTPGSAQSSPAPPAGARITNPGSPIVHAFEPFDIEKFEQERREREQVNEQARKAREQGKSPVQQAKKKKSRRPRVPAQPPRPRADTSQPIASIPAAQPPRVGAGSSQPSPPPARRPPAGSNSHQRIDFYLRTEQWDLFNQETKASDERRRRLMPVTPDYGPRCKAATSKGLTCRGPVDNDGDLCYFHDPAKADERREGARRGGIASGESRRNPRPLLEPRVATLTDPLSIQVLLDAVLRLEMLGKMTDARGKRLAKLLALAVKNVGRDGLDSAAYTARRNSLDSELSDVVRQYERTDHEHHFRAIAAVGLKRQEVLKANELFADAP
ncbi:MAG: hypothetical protein WD557_20305 [Dehalococcoidia bacterium]